MKKIDDPALANHRVIVEVLLQPFPEFERVFVESFVFTKYVIRADDCGVSTNITAANSAFF